MRRFFKVKNFFLISFLAVAGIFSTGAIITSKQAKDNGVVEEANAFDFGFYQNVMLYRKYKNKGWASANAKTAVKFFDNCGNECWSNIVDEANDVFKGGSDGWGGDYVDFFVYPNNMDHEWTKFQMVRVDKDATSEPWNHVWNWAPQKNMTSSFNCFGPADASNTTDINFVQIDVNGATYAGGDTLYIRDTDGDAWTADNHTLQVHLWGNSLMTGSRYIDATKVEGDYKDTLDDPVEHLYEAVIPDNVGRYKWFQLKRLNPGGSAINQSNDFEVDTTKNVFEYKGTGWSGGIMDGEFKWNINNEGRSNIYARYLLQKTGEVCTDNPSQSDLSPSLETNWGLTKTQYDNMSTTCQGTFYSATAGESGSLQKAAKRYDRIVYLYGKDRDSGARIGTRSGRLSDYVNRHATSNYSFGSIRTFSPIELIVGADKEADATVTLIIVMSSISILSITALSVLLVKKHKRKEQ